MKKEVRFVLQFIGISALSLAIACTLGATKTQHQKIKKIEVRKIR
jgi:hypothetical protein